jgi:CelD/BcsL family acetyltransferase involved in cellulose biosynthesis
MEALKPAGTASAASIGDYKATLQRLDRDADLTTLAGGARSFPFQAPFWLSSWFATMASDATSSCYLMTVSEKSGQRLLSIPLVLRKVQGLRQIEMPDGGASDYLAPVFFTREPPEASAIWPVILEALPPADILSFQGLRPELDDVPNPLARHPLAQLSRLRGSEVKFPNSWDEYFGSLSSRSRQDMNRWRRRFLEKPDARFEIAQNLETALRWLDQFDEMQAERLSEKGIETSVTSPAFSKLYRQAATRGIATHEVLMAGLFAGDQTIALGYAVCSGERAVYVRVASLKGDWSQVRPGILVSELMMKQAHAVGVRIFDFGLGEYEYKRRLGAIPFDLVDLDIPLSAKGQICAHWRFLKRRFRANPLLRKLTGRKPLSGATNASEPSPS